VLVTLSMRSVLRVLAPSMVCASVIGGGVALTLRPPVYEARAHVVVTPLAPSEAPAGMPVFRDLGDPIRTIETAAALLSDRRAAELSARRLRGHWTTDEVQRAIMLRPQGQTNIIDVVGRADSPEQAAAVANAYGVAALDLRRQALAAASTAALVTATQQVNTSPAGSAAAEAARARFASLDLLKTYGDPSVTEAQEAVAPTSPAGLPDRLVLALAALAGLFAAAGLASVMRIDRPAKGRTSAAPGLATVAEPPSPAAAARPGGVVGGLQTPAAAVSTAATPSAVTTEDPPPGRTYPPAVTTGRGEPAFSAAPLNGSRQHRVSASHPAQDAETP
jgi:capsular polysaccharide biosynthesis protein